MDRSASRLLNFTFALTVFGAVGCQQIKPNTEQPASIPTTIVDDATWPFWPVSMSVHALTRITIDRSEKVPVLEARVEFTDAEGTTSKSFGQILLELTDDVSSNEGGVDSEVWSIDLRDLRINATHFDDVTQTYLFKLRLDPARKRNRPQLRVEFHSANGTVMTDWRSVRPYVIEAASVNDNSDDSP